MVNETDLSYRQRVLACWLGKAVGSTLGLPVDGSEGPHDFSFYNPVPTEVVPSDDLELQATWAGVLDAMDEPSVSRAVLAKAWREDVDLSRDAYGIAKRNLTWGLMPPLSGAFDNWFNSSMDAAVRSEIWACLAPGNSEVAGAYAYEDAMVDHAGEGIWGAVFLAALQAGAFTATDADAMLDKALREAPGNSQVYNAVTDARTWWKESGDWKAVREQLIERYRTLNTSDVSLNMGFIILGWLAGEGDFTKSVCTTVNCGFASRANGAAVGALVAISDPDSIPQKWLTPLGITLKADETAAPDAAGELDEVDVMDALETASEFTIETKAPVVEAVESNAETSEVEEASEAVEGTETEDSSTDAAIMVDAASEADSPADTIIDDAAATTEMEAPVAGDESELTEAEKAEVEAGHDDPETTLDSKEDELTEDEAQLDGEAADLSEAQTELDEAQAVLDEKQVILDAAQEGLDEEQATLDEAQAELAETEAAEPADDGLAELNELTDLVVSLRERLGEKFPPFSDDDSAVRRGMVTAKMTFVDKAPAATGDAPALPTDANVLTFPGTIGMLPKEIFTGEAALLRYTIEIPESRRVRVMFNASSPNDVWLDRKHVFGTKTPVMAPSFDRVPEDQRVDITLDAGKHTLVAAVHQPTENVHVEWVIGVADASTLQWLTEAVYSAG